MEDTSKASMLRHAEILLLVYFVYTPIVAQLLRVRRGAARRVLVTNMSVVVACALLAVALREWNAFGITRDWAVLLLTILCYKEMGWLATPEHTDTLEKRWIGWDRRLLTGLRVKAAIESWGPVFPTILELSYALVYAMPVFGLVTLYVYGRSDESDRFLSQFLLATLPSYAMFPFFPSEPPRTVFPDDHAPSMKTPIRRLNLWLLARAGIHTSVFPSAHVSGAFGVAFGILRTLPDHSGIGWGLGALASSIALATVYGRYHYFVDAVAGVGVSLLGLCIAIAWDSW